MIEAVDTLLAAPGDISRGIVDFAGVGPSPIRRRVVETPDGRSIAYAETGEGPAVLLIHGTLTTLEDMWLGLAETLARGGFRVIAADRPGHGESARARFVDGSPWRQAEILRDAMSAIGAARPTIVGHSAGGAVALAYGLLYPDEIAGVVALSPICFPEPRLEQMLFGARAAPFAGPALAMGSRVSLDAALLPTLWRAMFFPQRMPRHFEDGFPFSLAGRPAQLVAEAEDSLALGPALLRSAMSYPACRTPVEILGGDADIVIVNGLHGYRAAAMIRGANYTTLPGMGHMWHHFQPEEALAAVRRAGARGDETALAA